MRRMTARLLLCLALAFATPACAETTPAAPAPDWEIVQTLPHDPAAFTQGLFIADGLIYESTGLNGQSELRVYKPGETQSRRTAKLDRQHFGEGSTIWGDRIFSLTWQSETGFIWRRSDFKPLGSFRYSGEGWGLTQDGKQLIMSDGTDTLRMLDPRTLKQTGTLKVSWQGEPVQLLNELEWVNGEIFANVWYSPNIARIDPKTGVVTGWLNLAPLVSENGARDRNAVLNGIAWDAKARLLYVTGKNWPRLYALRLNR
jgi:glutaminyl-peptide cyclotransferase